MRLRTLAAAAALLVGLTGCASNGWDGLPLEDPDDNPDTCFTITDHRSDGWSHQETSLGVYCPATVTP